jgi:uncharacterized protein
MVNTDPIEVALFPIPNVVAFPGMDLPLHVFEPRYRRLVHDCVDSGRLVGVCHVRKTIHEPKKHQTIEAFLSSNQATYAPREVFSAGRCEILETTTDGRIMARVLMSQRLELVEEIQSLPYRIVACAEVVDDAEDTTESENQELRDVINKRLIEIVRIDNSEIAEALSDAQWAAQDPAEYSFSIFRFLRFEADIMQTILEARSVHTRLEMIWELLRT